jgi:hypothetical protein
VWEDVRHFVREPGEVLELLRRQLVRLVVSGIAAGWDADGGVDVRITYRFGPPETQDMGEVFAVGVNDSP